MRSLWPRVVRAVKKKKQRKDDLALAYARLNAAATDFFVNWPLKVSENLV